jgi:hypothetical protein
MTWRVVYHPIALQELADQPDDIVAHLTRIIALVAEHGLERLPGKLVKHIDGQLWEFRLSGRDRIARAFYVTSQRPARPDPARVHQEDAEDPTTGNQTRAGSLQMESLCLSRDVAAEA